LLTKGIGFLVIGTVKPSLYRPGETLRVPAGRASQVPRKSAHETIRG